MSAHAVRPASERAGPVADGAPGPIGPLRGATVAAAFRPLLDRLFPAGPPIRFSFWDGSSTGDDSTVGTAILRSPVALSRMLWAPGELGLARAFVAGDLDLEGDTAGVLRSLIHSRRQQLPRPSEIFLPGLDSVRRLRAMDPPTAVLGTPPRPPASEARLSRWRRSGALHSPGRDAAAVTHHYDVGNDFYRLVLGPSLTYSCARFDAGSTTLEEAQRSKHELICRKLGLHERPGARLLDVGCGWGSMALHAALEHGARVVGVTLSPAQAELARRRVHDAELDGLVEIRIQDYRELGGEQFDAISSIGMFEHVGVKMMPDYFSTLFSLLAPRGRLLNHAISSRGGSRMRGRTFMNRYVFPDGELIDVADAAGAMEVAGFEVRDVESLREHYARTLRQWLANLESNWDEAVALAGAERARVWRLYMAASVNGFEDGGIAIHQILGVRPGEGGASGMPPTRTEWG